MRVCLQDQGVRFEGGQGWRDLPWAILFIVHFVIIFILAIVGGVNLKAYEQAPPFAGFGAIGQAIAGTFVARTPPQQ